MAYDKIAYEKHKHKVLERQRKRRAERRKWFNEEILSKAVCVKCGEDHPACMDFHHRDPDKKDFGIGCMTQLNKNKQQILDELQKCDTLCANCHRKLHWQGNIGE